MDDVPFAEHGVDGGGDHRRKFGALISRRHDGDQHHRRRLRAIEAIEVWEKRQNETDDGDGQEAEEEVDDAQQDGAMYGIGDQGVLNLAVSLYSGYLCRAKATGARQPA